MKRLYFFVLALLVCCLSAQAAFNKFTVGCFTYTETMASELDKAAAVIAEAGESVDYVEPYSGYIYPKRPGIAQSGELVIPESVSYDGKTYIVTDIGDLGYCPNITALSIPKTVTYLIKFFMNAPLLERITVAEGNTDYDSRDDCNAIIETATNTLVMGCKSTTIPATVTSIGEGAFQNCTGLTNIIIPEGVTSIGEGAFRDCMGLTSVTFPASVTSIEASAFRACISLTDIYISGGLQTEIYDSYKRVKCTIHVDNEASLDYYLSKGYKAVLDGGANGVETPHAATAASAVTGCYDLGGHRVSQPVTHGVTVVRHADGTTRKVMSR